jgi:4-amino-4-deoxy-L-arabinose transferase-like glycosyltransferase
MNQFTPFRGGAAELRWCAALTCACALALRWWYAQGGLVPDPIVGDAIHYADYAWNLVHFHTFSMAPPGSEQVVPDSYRDPLYPMLLAVLLRIFGSGEAWYHAVISVQVALGALSAGLTVLIASRWLRPRAALAAGLAVAVWPHSVAISSYLLTETLFAFMILLALWQLLRACESGRLISWAAAGIGFGGAALVNATLAPFGVLLALALWIRRMISPESALALLLGAMILPCAWTARNLMLQTDSSAASRAVANLVQGSWPEYHAAFMESVYSGKNNEIMSAIDRDNDLASSSLPAWLGVLSSRIEQQPLRYAAWYAYKPVLLWAWRIRIGVGDIYPYRTLHPIYSTSAIMRAFESLCVGINPVLFVLMAAGVLVILLRPAVVQASIGLYAVALLVAYETLVYTALQAEPRYSIPFRPEQMILVVSVLAWMLRAWQLHRRKTQAMPEMVRNEE